MSLDTNGFVVDGKLYDLGLTPAAYTGGTDLGDFGSAAAISVDHEIELRQKQTMPGNWAFRLLGTQGLLEIILLNRSQAVLDLIYHDRSASLGYTGVGLAYKRGHIIKAGDAGTTCLMLRPSDATKPSYCWPSAFVTSVGPKQVIRSGLVLDATVLTIASLYHPTVGTNFMSGDYANWPAFSPSAPVISAITPDDGDTDGGTTVWITGTNLFGAAVTFGGDAGSVLFNNATSILVTTPAHAAGAVNVVVTTAGGSDTEVNGFTYVEDLGT